MLTGSPCADRKRVRMVGPVLMSLRYHARPGRRRLALGVVWRGVARHLTTIAVLQPSSEK